MMVDRDLARLGRSVTARRLSGHGRKESTAPSGPGAWPISRSLGAMTTPYDDEPVLPEQTRDDDPRSWGEKDSTSEDDERILREVPPHHN